MIVEGFEREISSWDNCLCDTATTIAAHYFLGSGGNGSTHGLVDPQNGSENEYGW